MRRFRVGSLPAGGGRVFLEGDAAHHLLDVIRVKRGEGVILFDGQGAEAVAVLQAGGPGAAVLEVQGPIYRAPIGSPVEALLAVTKGPAMDAAVRAAVEAGATRIRPMLTSRSVARGERVDRWERIVESAAQQCGNPVLPRVEPVAPYQEALASVPEGFELRIAQPGAPRATPARGAVAVLVGPEGGFTPAEVDVAVSRGAVAVGLGRWILRAETAAAVAVAMSVPVEG